METSVEAVVTEETPNYRTLEGLKQHPLFNLLTARQQKFLVAYIENNGDREAAVRSAGFRTRNGKFDQEAMRLLRSAYIRKLTAIFYGYNIDQAPMSRQELIGLISARLRKPEASDTIFSRLVDQFLELSQRNRKKQGRPTTEEGIENNDASADHIDKLVQQLEKERLNGHINSQRDKEAD